MEDEKERTKKETEGAKEEEDKQGRLHYKKEITKRREYKEWCKTRKREHVEEEEIKIRGIRTEAEAWKYINKYKGRRGERISKDIEMDEWRGYFMEALEGTQERTTVEMESSEGEEEEGEEETAAVGDITKEETIEVLKKLKRAKAPGENGIENEAWRYMSKDLGEEFWKLINKVWKGEGIPGDWNKGVISPIHNRGERDELKNYRGITLMDTAYKIYASILNNRLEKEVDERLRETQFGFRKGRGVMDAVYILNYIVNKELSRKRGKVFALFVDLKAAFDSVDRRQLHEMLRRIKVERNLRRRIMETYKETRNIV